MNNKRQTIWLVSMLSLMVILSAYYLFTEDVSTQQNVNGGNLQAEAGDYLPESSGRQAEGVEVTEIVHDTGATASGLSEGDEAVLNEYTNLKGREYFDHLQRLRQEKYDSESEKLSAIVADTKNHSQEEASSAVEELARLDDTDARITRLEEKLLQDYENAVVTEESLNFKVIVQAPKLEKKQAVDIIDLATKELKVTPDRLTVQYVE
jgi:stage III sporulation protein AH